MAAMEARPPAVGRPRDAALDVRIPSAALAVLRARGPAGVTVEAVAEKARCGKTSIYRRYPNSESILAAALAGLAEPALPRTGDLSPREHLIAALEQFHQGVEQQIGLRAAASLLYDSTSPFAELMRRHLIAPRLRFIADLIGDAQRRGDVPASIKPESLLRALAGSYFIELAATGKVGRHWARDLVDQFWRSWQQP